MGSINATFTKWMVGEGPEMAGVVGGEVGEGVYAGRVLEMVEGPTTIVSAVYQLQGSERAFSALVHVEQTGLHAESDRRRDRWLGQGRAGHGEYAQITCEHDGVTTDCWRGTLMVTEAASKGSLAAV